MNIFLVLFTLLHAGEHQMRVSSNHTDPVHLYNAALECVHGQDLPQALSYFSLAQEHTTDPELSYKINYNRINAYAHQEEYQQALDLCEQLHKEKPQDERLLAKIEYLKNKNQQQENAEKKSPPQEQKPQDQDHEGQDTQDDQRQQEERKQDQQPQEQQSSAAQDNTKHPEQSAKKQAEQDDSSKEQEQQEPGLHQSQQEYEHSDPTKDIRQALEDIDHRYAQALLKKQVSRMNSATDKSW